MSKVNINRGILGKVVTKTNRFMELEGVRGLAAVAVVFFHYLYAFYPSLITGNMSTAHTRFEDNIHGTPIALLYGGTFAVVIFFVLSGFVLSIAYFQTKNENIIKKMATNRYLRLMLPALASVMIAYILLSLGFASIPEQVGDATGSRTWLSSWMLDPTSFLSALKNGTIDIFVNGYSMYNNVLWTMHVEFLGSFLVFGLLIFFGKSRDRWLAYLLLAALTFNTWFLPFVIGVIIADAHTLGLLEKLKRWYIVLPMIMTAILLGAFPHRKVDGTIYEVLTKLNLEKFFGVENIDYKVFYLTIAATLLVLAVLLSRRITKFLQWPRVSVLGKYTFSLYLMHLIVLYVFSCSLFLILRESLGYNTTVMIVVAASLPVLIVATVLFERCIDAPSIQFAKYVGAVYRGEKKINTAEVKDKFRLKAGIWFEKYLGIPAKQELNRKPD